LPCPRGNTAFNSAARLVHPRYALDVASLAYCLTITSAVSIRPRRSAARMQRSRIVRDEHRVDAVIARAAPSVSVQK
jgi:hypothetical protein